MNTVERVKNLCKERNIPIAKLERDCGFSNGYISSLRKGTLPNDRLLVIADYLGVDSYFLSTGNKGLNMTIRERIKEECENKGISLNKLEMDCGLAKGYISKLDKSTPNANKLQAIADYLGVSLDYLMNGNKDGYYIDDELLEFAKKIYERKVLREIFDLFIDLDDDDAVTVIPILQALQTKARK